MARSSTEYDVFISYCHRDKTTVEKIYKSLKKEGYKIWIDSECMQGSLLEAMAEAVEKSTVVLICMSEPYSQSKNCQKEAEYADEKGKKIVPLLVQKGFKPEGWLGILLGKKLYFDFGGKYPYQESFSKLLKEIRSQLPRGSTVSRTGHMDRKQIRRLFDDCDLNGDGSISASELEYVARALGMKPTRAQIKAGIAKVDLNGDGKLQFEEVVKAFENMRCS